MRFTIPPTFVGYYMLYPLGNEKRLRDLTSFCLGGIPNLFPNIPPGTSSAIPHDRVFELNELCRLFLGRVGQRGFELCFFCYCYAGLWLYGSVWAAAGDMQGRQGTERVR